MSWDKSKLGTCVVISADYVNKSSGAKQDGGEAWRREQKMRFMRQRGLGLVVFFFFFA